MTSLSKLGNLLKLLNNHAFSYRHTSPVHAIQNSIIKKTVSLLLSHCSTSICSLRSLESWKKKILRLICYLGLISSCTRCVILSRRILRREGHRYEELALIESTCGFRSVLVICNWVEQRKQDRYIFISTGVLFLLHWDIISVID